MMLAANFILSLAVISVSAAVPEVFAEGQKQQDVHYYHHHHHFHHFHEDLGGQGGGLGLSRLEGRGAAAACIGKVCRRY